MSRIDKRLSPLGQCGTNFPAIAGRGFRGKVADPSFLEILACNHVAKTTKPALELQQRTKVLLRILQKHYQSAQCALTYKTPFELLVATILSAQCTDQRVNQVTPALFEKHKTPFALALAKQAAVEKLIASCGFFRSKAKNLIACAARLVSKHQGEIPKRLEDLVELPGVGRKTANVVLGTAFGIPSGVVVDTHVGRISQRLGLTSHTDPVRIEQDLIALLPQRSWIAYSHQLIHHGRQICKARKPLCDACPLAAYCPKIGVAAKGK
jgi:endonuclease-3